jgi:FkbM family methyltransferase
MSDPAPFNRMKACRHGTLLFNVNDQYVGRALDLYGEYSEAEVELFRRILRAGDIVVDVGANLGAHTLFFSTTVGPRGAVLAFEPQRLIFQTLCANMALNNVTNTVCYWTALTDAPGVMSVPVLDPRQPYNFGGVGLGGHTRGDQINVMRADSFALPRCRLIKIDVEGMELQVLKGATGLLERHYPVVYVENDRPQHADALVRWIHALGYRLYWHRPPLYNPQNFFGNPHNEYPGIVSLNMLCVHPEQEVDVPDLSPVRIT